MKEVFIKYNPYKLETEVKIDGSLVKENSALNIGNERLQEWLENLPKILLDECNSKEFKVVFHGTVLDYEDLLSVAKEAKKNNITIECEHIPAKEVGDKEQAIDMLFAEIKDGPFDELRQTDVIRAFELAKSSDFEVNVVATMSAGKSTLINALLRQKLMPAKQEACTATITKIKDSVSDTFRATVKDKNGDLLETHPVLTLEIMNNLNENPSVSLIEVEGDIPFVSPEEVALVLVDTPGPNNSRDPEHRAATYRMLSESSKAVVLYVLNATQLAADDDSNLLDHVAKSMGVGGKQSKDRFMFIVNKLDDFRAGEDSVISAIEKVRKYLEDKGIMNANIFPAAALPALEIRTKGSAVDISGIKTLEELEALDPEVMEFVAKVRKINRNEMLHLDDYAPLTPSVRGEVTNELVRAKETSDAYAEALIHTGIIPIELAIRMYVQKYAKTAKVKNIVDTFAKKLESAKSFENTKQEIAENQDKQREILANIDAIKAKLKSGEEGKKFKEKVNAINYDKEIAGVANGIIKEAQKKVSAQSASNTTKLSRKDAESICAVFSKFAEQLQAEIQIKLEDAITNHVDKNARDLLNQYISKISALSKDLNVGTVEVNPFNLIDGDINGIGDVHTLINSLVKSERVVVGTKWVEPEKKWYNPFTWFKSGYEKDVYGDSEYIDGSELAQKFFAPIQKQLFDNSDSAIKYAKEQTMQIKLAFNKKFAELDAVLNRKLEELELCASDKKSVETVIKQTKDRLAWLEKIQNKAADILEI